MTTSTLPTPTSERRDPARLPWAALLVMALTGFIIIATETMPAGLLPQIATGLHVTEGAAGQFVSVYALGTVLAAIPAITLTRGTRRKPLLIAGILGFLVANTITALSPDLTLSLAARLIAGAFSGLLWGMLAGYARRIVAHEHSGRALAIAMTGTPVALSVGTPLGSWIGTAFRLALVFRRHVGTVNPRADPRRGSRTGRTRPGSCAALPLRRVIGIPGVSVILTVVFTWMLAHNIEYTYIASYLQSADLDRPVDLALVAFGVAALIGIWVTGLVIDHNLRGLVLGSIGLFLIAGVTFIVGAHSLGAVLVAIVLWGLAFGGAATQLQTAMGEASGENADVANSLLTVSFNLAIFAAGVGGALVIGVDAVALPIVMVIFAAAALIVVAIGRRSAFPRNASRTG